MIVDNSEVSGLLTHINYDKIILLVHGFGASKKTKQFDGFEKDLNELGFSTFRVDLFGHGKFSEDFEKLTVTKAIECLPEFHEFV